MTSENDSKIDLSSVNKSKKTFQLPKLKNPFKRQSGPSRDSEGKFATGSGGLLQSKKLNLKRSLPLVAIVAVVGGFFVYQSFADTKKPNYQYSVFDCSEVDNKSKTPNYTCQDYSAEAGVYRAYQAVLGRYPSTGDYKSWVQPMVGGDAKSEAIPGRMSYETVIKRLMGTAEAKAGKGIMSNSPNDGQVVSNVFKNALGRAATNVDVFNWVKLKGDRKWNTEQLVLQIISLKEPREKQRPSFLSAVQNKRVQKFSITDYASRRVTNRNNLANSINQNNKSTLKLTKERNEDNRKRLATSQAIAARAGANISKGDYESIKNNNADVIKARASGFRGSEYIGRVNTRLKQIGELNDTTNQVKRSSPDLIKDDKMKREYDYAAYVRDQMNNEIKHADWLYSEAMRSYSTAKSKYDSHQAYLALQAAIASCRNGGNIWQNGTCVPKPQAPTPSSPGGGGDSGGSNPVGGSTPSGIPCPTSGGPYSWVSSLQKCYNLSTKSQPYCTDFAPPYRMQTDNNRCVKEDSRGRVVTKESTCGSKAKRKMSFETKYFCYNTQGPVR